MTPRERGPFSGWGPFRGAHSAPERPLSSCVPLELSVFGASEVAAVAPSDAVGGPVIDGGGRPAARLAAALPVGDDDVRWGHEALAGVRSESAGGQAGSQGEAGHAQVLLGFGGGHRVPSWFPRGVGADPPARAHTPGSAFGWSREVMGRGPTVSRGATPLASLVVSAVSGPEHLPQLDDCYDGSRESENNAC